MGDPPHVVRTVRQDPLEVDPPVHEEYCRIVEPFFLRPKQPHVLAKIHGLIDPLLTSALEAPSNDAVNYFAIPLQSRALTYLLNVPEKEAELWVGVNSPKMTVRFPPGEPWGKMAMKNPVVPKPPTLVK